MSTNIPLGTDDWESAAENISRIRLRNLYLADNPLSPDGLSRVSRPTLSSLLSVGDGPINGIWRQEGTFNGDWLVVSANKLYRVSLPATVTLLDDLPGEGLCQFAGNATRVIVVRDGVAYSTDGAMVTIVVMPDDVDPYTPEPAPVGSVACINSSFLLSVEGLQRFYWIFPDEVDPDPLSFASAERTPDPIVSINIVGDEIWIVQVSGPEVWTATGDIDVPYQRVSGRVYNEGCASRDAVVQITYKTIPSLFWVTDTRSVVMTQGAPTKISTESIEELLKNATNLRAWPFRYNRHDFVILSCDEFTLSCDLSNFKWARWDSHGMVNWRAHLGLQVGSTAYAGDSTTGNIWRLEEGYTDNGLPVIREVSGGVVHNDKPVGCANVYVRMNAGYAPEYTETPLLEMRFSEDQGASWSNYFQTEVGNRGEYDTEVIFRSLGQVKRPGRLFEFRFSDPARFRLDYAEMNVDR